MGEDKLSAILRTSARLALAALLAGCADTPLVSPGATIPSAETTKGKPAIHLPRRGVRDHELERYAPETNLVGRLRIYHGIVFRQEDGERRPPIFASHRLETGQLVMEMVQGPDHYKRIAHVHDGRFFFPYQQFEELFRKRAGQGEVARVHMGHSLGDDVVTVDNAYRIAQNIANSTAIAGLRFPQDTQLARRDAAPKAAAVELVKPAASLATIAGDATPKPAPQVTESYAKPPAVDYATGESARRKAETEARGYMDHQAATQPKYDPQLLIRQKAQEGNDRGILRMDADISAATMARAEQVRAERLAQERAAEAKARQDAEAKVKAEQTRIAAEQAEKKRKEEEKIAAEKANRDKLAKLNSLHVDDLLKDRFSSKPAETGPVTLDSGRGITARPIEEYKPKPAASSLAVEKPVAKPGAEHHYILGMVFERSESVLKKNPKLEIIASHGIIENSSIAYKVNFPNESEAKAVLGDAYQLLASKTQTTYRRVPVKGTNRDDFFVNVSIAKLPQIRQMAHAVSSETMQPKPEFNALLHVDAKGNCKDACASINTSFKDYRVVGMYIQRTQ